MKRTHPTPMRNSCFMCSQVTNTRGIGVYWNFHRCGDAVFECACVRSLDQFRAAFKSFRRRADVPFTICSTGLCLVWNSVIRFRHWIQFMIFVTFLGAKNQWATRLAARKQETVFTSVHSFLHAWINEDEIFIYDSFFDYSFMSRHTKIKLRRSGDHNFSIFSLGFVCIAFENSIKNKNLHCVRAVCLLNLWFEYIR